MQKILVVDDAEEIIVAVTGALQPLGLGIETAMTVKDGLQKATDQLFDLVIIDIALPDGDGFDLFLKIRNIQHYERIPVIFLTSKEDVASKVSAFSLGADDYIVKPFHLLELRARIERRLKKQQEQNLDGDQVAAGPLVLEVSSQRLKVHGKNGYISLTPREFKILLLLVKSPDRIFTRETILNKIWGSDVYVTDRTVDAHICYLRKKLSKFSNYIESVPGEGYRFNPNPAH
jgi:DNA-binding response OmpR family regulator